MKDCVLSLLWPRKDIYSFFREHGCTAADLKAIDNFKEKELGRAEMVDGVFEQLSSRADGGLGQFRAMLQALSEWSHFDPYYFDKLRKLDRTKAQESLDHLRELQEIRDGRIKQERERRAAEDAARREPQVSLRELLQEFLALHSGRTDPQQRGYALEGLLLPRFPDWK
jgi:hypothetical protein